jgi:hypothetical protein
MGGLGNQLFQYALGFQLQQGKHPAVKFDDGLLRDKQGEHSVFTHRNLEIDQIFDLKLPLATEVEVEYFNGKKSKRLINKLINRFHLSKIKKKWVIENNRSFIPDILNITDDKCLIGAWQSEKYFESSSLALKKQLLFKNTLQSNSKVLLDKTNKNNTVCLHVRRGDYVTSPLYKKTIGALSVNYYRNAINHFSRQIEKPFFHIYSDDLEWCRKYFNDSNVILIENEHVGKNAFNYFQMMTQYTHYIISNSTFSWWAAWLGENKNSTIITPKIWTRDPLMRPETIVPERWIKLDNDFESLS